MAPVAAQEPWQWPLIPGETLQGPMMDFLEQTVEILTCDDTPSRDVAAHQAVACQDLLDQSTAPIVPTRDYAAMHDNFLESLLQEQARNPHPLTREDSFAPMAPPALSECASADSASTVQSINSQDSIKPPESKKRRVMRLHRRTSLKKRQHHHQAMQRQDSTTSEDDDSSYAPKRINLMALSTGQYLPPDCFVHANCRMQKDKGKGELPGKEVCAEGREACLEKLRQKMELLAQVALGNASPSSSTGKKGKASADMKRRKARISETSPDYTETRSIIQLRMGFLAMQYGVLLRWDQKSHLVTFVLLRKMCSESFYHKTLSSSKKSLAPTVPFSSETQSPLGYTIKNVVNGNCAILQHGGDVEMLMLDRPYLVPRPDTFAPSFLSVNVLNVDGLNPKSTWTVKVIVEGDSKSLRLGWNDDDASFEPRNSETMKMQWQVPTTFIDLQMDMVVYEQRRTQRRRRMKTTLPVPMTFLDATANSEAAKSRFIVVPVDSSSSLTLSINFQSDFCHWLQKEVDARKRQEVSGFLSFFSSSTTSSNPPTRIVETNVVSTPPSYLNPLGLCCAW